MNFHIDDSLPIEMIFTITKRPYTVAMLQQSNRGWRPIAFTGRALKDVELRYSPIELEFTAVKDTLKRYGYMLYQHELNIHLPHVWSELLSLEPTHSARIQKANTKIQEF